MVGVGGMVAPSKVVCQVPSLLIAMELCTGNALMLVAGWEPGKQFRALVRRCTGVDSRLQCSTMIDLYLDCSKH